MVMLQKQHIPFWLGDQFAILSTFLSRNNLRTLLVAKKIYVLRPESFCVSNFAIQKIQTFWASEGMLSDLVKRRSSGILRQKVYDDLVHKVLGVFWYSFVMQEQSSVAGPCQFSSCTLFHLLTWFDVESSLMTENVILTTKLVSLWWPSDRQIPLLGLNQARVCGGSALLSKS